MRDLAQEREYNAALRHFRQMSSDWRREQGDEFHACSWYESRWTTDRNITMTARGVTQDVAALEAITRKWFPGGIGDRSVYSPTVSVS